MHASVMGSRQISIRTCLNKDTNIRVQASQEFRCLWGSYIFYTFFFNVFIRSNSSISFSSFPPGYHAALQTLCCFISLHSAFFLIYDYLFLCTDVILFTSLYSSPPPRPSSGTSSFYFALVFCSLPFFTEYFSLSVFLSSYLHPYLYHRLHLLIPLFLWSSTFPPSVTL